MASVIKLGGGKQPPRAIDFYDPTDGNKRKRIRLGVVSAEDANQVCRLVEKLVAAKSLDAEVARWLCGLSDDIHQRIADNGLIEPRNPTAKLPTLGAFFAKYLEQRRSDLAPASIKRLELKKKPSNRGSVPIPRSPRSPPMVRPIGGHR